MDIIGKDALTLLQDENVRKTVDAVLQRETDSQTVTVTIPEHGSDRPKGEKQSKQVTVRRVA
jgi:hypothetical protein